MKKRIITITVLVVVILVVAWRFWPSSFVKLMPYDMESATHCTAIADIMVVSNGRVKSDSYKMEDMSSESLKKIMEFLETSKYRRDFRNLIPFVPQSLSSGKYFDGRAVHIYIYFPTAEGEYGDGINISWTGDQMAIWGISKYKARIYHPTDNETFDYLVGYLQANGVLQ